MDRKLTGTALGVLILAAGAFGMHIGQSAIDQINPIYFQGAAVHPRDRGAAVDETIAAASPRRFADFYGWADGQAARAADCLECDALAVRDAFHEGGVRYAVVETEWRSEPQATVYFVTPEPQPGPAEPAPAAEEPVDVERYASYPIEEKPAEREAPVEVAAAQD